MKKFLSILLCLGLFLGMSACGSDSDSGSADTTEEETQKTYKIKDKVKIGDGEFQVTKVETKKSVGDKYLNHEAQGTYLVISLSITNKGNEAITISKRDFTLMNGEKEYEVDDDAFIYLSKESLVREDINPDSTFKGKIAFDLNDKIAKSKDNKLQIEVGFWGSDTEIIELK